MKKIVAAAIGGLALIVFCLGCESQSVSKHQSKGTAIPQLSFAMMFSEAEIETKSWRLSDSSVISYLSKQAFHIQGRNDVVLFFYGKDQMPLSVDFYISAGNNYYFLIGHDAMDCGKITDSSLKLQGGRIFIDLVRVDEIARKQLKYSYEITQENVLVRTISSFITDVKGSAQEK